MSPKTNTPSPSENSGDLPSQKPSSELPEKTGKRAVAQKWSERVGKSFRKFKILEVNTGRRTRVLLQCFCGGTRWVLADSLKANEVKSCGCLEKAKNKSKHPLYNTWVMMRSRCRYPSQPNFPYYGGKGVTVCAEWEDFDTFVAQVGLRPSKCHSLDRIDNSKGYEPKNVRWATKEEQASNTQRNRYFEFQGEKRTVSQWARRFNVSFDWLHYRLIKKPQVPEELFSNLLSKHITP